VNPSSPEAETQLTDIREAARTTGKDLRLLNVSNDNDLDAAFATMVREQTGGLLVANDAFFVGRREQIVALAARHAIPAMYFLREFAAVGGLMSYGNSLADAYHRVGIFTGKVLRGTKPADLPVEQAMKIELVLNLKTAKALGRTGQAARARRRGDRVSLAFAHSCCCICSRPLLAHHVDSLRRRSLDAIEGEADIPRTRRAWCSDVK
jgi:ABC-type uncharacterized transport system substrate-binding protein